MCISVFCAKIAKKAVAHQAYIFGKNGGKSVKVQESAEDYLESILILKEKKGLVRSIDVVHHMGYSKPSVSRAMSLLRENGYVEMDKEGFLTLTEAGMTIASRIYERHRLLTQWLSELGVSPEVAAEDACRIEHVISEESFAAIKDHLKQTSV